MNSPVFSDHTFPCHGCSPRVGKILYLKERAWKTVFSGPGYVQGVSPHTPERRRGRLRIGYRKSLSVGQLPVSPEPGFVLLDVSFPGCPAQAYRWMKTTFHSQRPVLLESNFQGQLPLASCPQSLKVPRLYTRHFPNAGGCLPVTYNHQTLSSSGDTQI